MTRPARHAALLLACVLITAGLAAAHTSADATTAVSGLRVSGNHLVDTSTGTVVQLRGVNRSGTQYACAEGDGIFDGPSDDGSIAAMAAWGINAVRVNGNEDCALGINGVKAAYAGANYLNALKAYVGRLHAHGLYAIVDLHHSAPGSQLALDQQTMPDRDHADAYWVTMANTFKDDPAVLFDLYNEPFPDSNHDTTAAWTCVRDGGTCPGVGFTAAGMQEMLYAVRGTGATNVVMISGPQYAGVLDRWLEFEPSDPLGQLAASVHIYGLPLDSPYSSPGSWDAGLLPVAAKVPVIEGEGMDHDCTHTLSDQWLPWADAHGISYTFWAWFTGSCANEPALISNYDGTPTAYGIGLKNWLAAHPTAAAPPAVSPSLSPAPAPSVSPASPTPTPTPIATACASRTLFRTLLSCTSKHQHR